MFSCGAVTCDLRARRVENWSAWSARSGSNIWKLGSARSALDFPPDAAALLNDLYADLSRLEKRIRQATKESRGLLTSGCRPFFPGIQKGKSFERPPEVDDTPWKILGDRKSDYLCLAGDGVQDIGDMRKLHATLGNAVECVRIGRRVTKQKEVVEGRVQNIEIEVNGHSLRASRSQPFEDWCHRFSQILRPQTGKLPILDKARLVGVVSVGPT
jgi:hypothetical protein